MSVEQAYRRGGISGLSTCKAGDPFSKQGTAGRARMQAPGTHSHTHTHLIIEPWGVVPNRARHSSSIVPPVARQSGALVHGGDGIGGDRGVQLAVWLGVLRDDLIRGHCVSRAELQSGKGTQQARATRMDQRRDLAGSSKQLAAQRGNKLAKGWVRMHVSKRSPCMDAAAGRTCARILQSSHCYICMPPEPWSHRSR